MKKSQGPAKIFSGGASKSGLQAKLSHHYGGEAHEEIMGTPIQTDIVSEGGPHGPRKSGGPADPKEIALENVTVTGDKQKVGANDAKVLTHLKESGRDAKSVSEAMKKWGSSRVHQSAKHARGADYTLFQGQYGRG